MKLIHCEQGSDLWKLSRAGCITASMFAIARSRVDGLTEQQQIYVDAILDGKSEERAKVIAQYKSKPKSEKIDRALAGEIVRGKPSEMALNYAFRLAVERISGLPLDDGYESWSAARGHELEPVARSRHMEEKGVWVERIGFVTTDDGVFGASLDGVIEPDGAAEYKAFLDPAKLRAILIDGDIGEVRQQAQGCLWITRRSWIDVCLYCPALAPAGKDLWVKRFARDDDFIETMELELVEFKNLVDGYEKQLREPYAEPSGTEPVADDSWPFPTPAAA
jgi:hypothetical protein